MFQPEMLQILICTKLVRPLKDLIIESVFKLKNKPEPSNGRENKNWKAL